MEGFETNKEIECQFLALKKLSHGNNEIAENYCNWGNKIITRTFRKIIDEYEKGSLHKIPTPDELIISTIFSLKHDIRTIF